MFKENNMVKESERDCEFIPGLYMKCIDASGTGAQLEIPHKFMMQANAGQIDVLIINQFMKKITSQEAISGHKSGPAYIKLTESELGTGSCWSMR